MKTMRNTGRLAAIGLLAVLSVSSCTAPDVSPARPAPDTGKTSSVAAPAAPSRASDRSTAKPAAAHLVGTGSTSPKHVVNVRDLTPGRQIPSAFTPTTAGMTLVSQVLPLDAVSTPAGPTAPVTPTISANFKGIGEGANRLGPSDANAAVGRNDIVEVVNTYFSVYTKTGAQRCGNTLTALLAAPAGEQLTDPRVIYDNVNDKFIVMAGIVDMSTSPDGVEYIRMGTSNTGDPCLDWNDYALRSTGGGTLPAGTILVDQPVIGQDNQAILFGIQSEGTTAATGDFVFALTKACAYSPDSCDFDLFATPFYSTPASNGGVPMIDTLGAAYFVSFVTPGAYVLYKMIGTGQPHPVVNSPISIGAGLFGAPSRDIRQPGTDKTLDEGLGVFSTRIKSTPIFDGTRIWVTHGVDNHGYPGILYGAINVTTNTAAVNFAYHSAKSDDFNSSIGVAMNGTARTIFLNWAYTDADAGLPVTDTVAVVQLSDAGAAPPAVVGKDRALTNAKTDHGYLTTEHSFGDYSSVSLDPTSGNGCAAVSANQFFDINGRWMTRISRFGTC